MKSTSGEHYVGLDHVRALAVFIVFFWHFLHGYYGQPIAFDYAPAVFPLAILDEGHTGVAMFMALSGYLFAKLLNGQSIRYGVFLWNRMVRIAPLLLLVVFGIGAYRYLTNENFSLYVKLTSMGWILPTLPNGAWSVTTELHFYLLLPLILLLARKSAWCLAAILVASMALRAYLHHRNGEVQTLSYLTLIGRIDQFVLGILAFQLRNLLHKRHWLACITAIAFMLFYAGFDWMGGFWTYPSYPSPTPLWIVLPTIEGLTYAMLIGYYDMSFKPANTGLSAFIARFGTYSYSIYLLHFFVVFKMAELIGSFADLSNFYVACAWSATSFLLMYPVGYASFHMVEKPFLGLRRRYLAPAEGPLSTSGSKA